MLSGLIRPASALAGSGAPANSGSRADSGTFADVSTRAGSGAPGSLRGVAEEAQPVTAGPVTAGLVTAQPVTAGPVTGSVAAARTPSLRGARAGRTGCGAGLSWVGGPAHTVGARRAPRLDRAGAGAGGVELDRLLPVLPELRGLLPGQGLRRGSTVAVSRSGAAGSGQWPVGATSLVLALLAEASRTGSWCAVVGVPTLGLVAAAEFGIALDRLALVPNPGPEWPTVVAALIDGVDIVVVAVPGQVAGGLTSRLVARARQRGCVLVPYGRWAGADVVLTTESGAWQGLGAGRGRLTGRRVTVVAQGRGAAGRAVRRQLWLPSAPPALTGTPALPGAPAAGEPALPALDGPTPRRTLSSVIPAESSVTPAGSGVTPAGGSVTPAGSGATPAGSGASAPPALMLLPGAAESAPARPRSAESSPARPRAAEPAPARPRPAELPAELGEAV